MLSTIVCKKNPPNSLLGIRLIMCKIILNNGKILIFFLFSLMEKAYSQWLLSSTVMFINITKICSNLFSLIINSVFFSFRQRIPSHLYPVSSWLGCDSPYIMPLLTNSVLQCSALCVMYSNKLILNVCFGTIQLIIYAYEMWSIKILKIWIRHFYNMWKTL